MKKEEIVMYTTFTLLLLLYCSTYIYKLSINESVDAWSSQVTNKFPDVPYKDYTTVHFKNHSPMILHSLQANKIDVGKSYFIEALREQKQQDRWVITTLEEIP